MSVLAERLDVIVMTSATKGNMYFEVGEKLRWDVWGSTPG
jgi:hypothetical protein